MSKSLQSSFWFAPARFIAEHPEWPDRVTKAQAAVAERTSKKTLSERNGYQATLWVRWTCKAAQL